MHPSCVVLTMRIYPFLLIPPTQLNWIFISNKFEQHWIDISRCPHCWCQSDFHVFAFSRWIWKKGTSWKNILAISAYIGNARAPFNALLKFSKQFVVIFVNRLSPSFDNAYWRPCLCKRFLIQLWAALAACLSFLLFVM